jgi:hypothetical protein
MNTCHDQDDLESDEQTDGEKLRVAPEMIAAGIAALDALRHSKADDAQLVKAIYIAMGRASQGHEVEVFRAFILETIYNTRSSVETLKIYKRRATEHSAEILDRICS